MFLVIPTGVIRKSSSWRYKGSTLSGCYFFCFSKRSNQEKETEIETHSLGQLTHKPEISARMNTLIERLSTIGRNLNTRDHAVYPHRHRFPELGSMIAQSVISAHGYRNRLWCAAGESSRALNSGAT